LGAAVAATTSTKTAARRAIFTRSFDCILFLYSFRAAYETWNAGSAHTVSFRRI
jgi:hypothetical protein